MFSSTILLLAVGVILIVIGLYILYPHHLSSKQKEIVIERGLVHFTTEEASVQILSSSMLKKNWLKKHTYFFLNVPTVPNYARFNNVSNKDAKIIVHNLSKEQLNKLKVRYYDLAILYRGDFYFQKGNETFSETVSEHIRNITNFKLLLLLSCILIGIGVTITIDSVALLIK